MTDGPRTPTQAITKAIRRGDIWWVRFDPVQGSEIGKSRPAIVLTADALNRVRRTVVVLPLSTGPKPWPPIVVSTGSAGPGSVAVCDHLRAVDKSWLTNKLGVLTAADLAAVESGVRAVLEL